MADWTAPYLGVQHLETNDKRHRATVTDRGTFAELSRWTPGCGFNPARSVHQSADEARAAGEQFIDRVAA